VIAQRDAEPGDIDDLVALIVGAIDTYRDWQPATWVAPDPGRHGAHWRRQLSARMLDDQARAIVAPEPDGRLAGVVGFTQARDAPIAGAPIRGTGHIWVLFVAPARWRRGVASALLDSAEAALRERAYERVILSTPAGAPACRFYEARGYEPDGRRAFYAPGALELVGYAKALETI
jgi:ribosomal protein S18 acetylase RimI-like enzyme